MIHDPSKVSGEELLRRIGPIRRARGYRLYSINGRRILDLSQDGGRGILGHRGGGSATVMKNALDRGPNSPLPSVYHAKLKVAVLNLIPGYDVIRVFSNGDRAVNAISAWLGRRVWLADVFDPVWTVNGLERQNGGPDGAAGSDTNRGMVRFWRPFLPTDHSPFTGLPDRWAILPILPSIGDSPPQVVIFSGSKAPESDFIASFRLAALVRGLYDLFADAGRAELSLAGFVSVGPYLLPRRRDRSYSDTFSLFLNEGFLISPDNLVPSVAPAQMSPGELDNLRRTAEFAIQSDAGNGH